MPAPSPRCKKYVSLPAPDLRGLVNRDELDEVPEQEVGRLGLVVEVGVVDVLAFEYLKKVPHARGTDSRERLTGDGDNRPAILIAVAQLNEGGEYRVGLAGARAPLVNLDLGRAVLDVVVCCRLSQLTVESSDTNHERGFFSATSISWRSTYPRPLPLVFRKKMVADGLPSLMSL